MLQRILPCHSALRGEMKSLAWQSVSAVDRWLFIVTLLLVFVGLVMVFSASAVMAKERYRLRIFLSAAATGMGEPRGIVAMVVAMKIDYRRYKHPAVVFSLLGFTTLMLISVFFLDRAHHTHRWIHWGRLFLPAIGNGETGAHFVSGIFS